MLDVSETLELVVDEPDDGDGRTAVAMPPSLLESPHNDPMRILVCSMCTQS